jgi:hypothetical protein
MIAELFIGQVKGDFQKGLSKIARAENVDIEDVQVKIKISNEEQGLSYSIYRKWRCAKEKARLRKLWVSDWTSIEKSQLFPLSSMKSCSKRLPSTNLTHTPFLHFCLNVISNYSWHFKTETNFTSPVYSVTYLRLKK